MSDIVQLLVYVSLTIVLAAGTIFDDIKRYLIDRVPPLLDKYVSSFVYCPMCIGFWVGFIGYLTFPVNMLDVFDSTFLGAIGCGCVTGVSASFLQSRIKF